MVVKETHITVNVSDMDTSILFYNSLGFDTRVRWNNHYAKLQMQGIIIGLHPTDKNNLAGNSGNLSIGFQVDDLEDAKKSLHHLQVAYTERNEEGGHFIHFN